MNKDFIEQQIRERYRLDGDKSQIVKETIINFLTSGKEPSRNPLAMIVGGQGGAGKTALMNYTTQMSDKRDFIVIDADFFREFHPQIDEIKELYPAYYTSATDQVALEIVSDSIDYFTNSDVKYDLIIQQTLKRTRIVDDAMTKLRDAGYTVGVRTLAVPYLESKMSQIERCQEQLSRFGFCRFVSKQDHDSAVEGLPSTVDYMEKSGKYDFLEIYSRGDSIESPILKYAKFNPQTEDKTKQTLEDCERVSHEDCFFGFVDARDAIETTREQEAVRCAKTLDDRIEIAEQSESNNNEMQTHIDELKLRFQEFKVEQGLIEPTSNISNEDAPSTEVCEE